jgi:SHS2 domain-containing protein
MYEIFAHTADLGLRVKAPDLNQLFAEAARGFFAAIVENVADVRPQERVEFKIEGSDPAYLLADWLNELLFGFESKRLLFCEFDVAVADHGLQATAKGERLDESRHRLEHEVKAITYHGLDVHKVNDDWMAEVILDI